MDITDVQLTGTGNYTLGNRMARRNHEVISRQIELLDRKRHEGQVGAVGLPCARQPLDKRCDGMLTHQRAAMFVREKIHYAEEIGLGPDLEDLLEHALGTCIRGQPFVHDCNLAELADCAQSGWAHRCDSHGEISLMMLLAVAPHE